MTSSHSYSEEDWIVHAHYGIGQIKGIEVKGISGEDVRYYRIRTVDSTYWIPLDQMENDVLRPLSSSEEVQLAMAVLQRPPKEMATDHNSRKSRIKRVHQQNSLEDIARLIRDLRGRQRDRGELNLEETSAMRTLKQRMVEELSLVTGKKSENVESTLDDLLDHGAFSAES